jgi:hypothetical protein
MLPQTQQDLAPNTIYQTTYELFSNFNFEWLKELAASSISSFTSITEDKHNPRLPRVIPKKRTFYKEKKTKTEKSKISFLSSLPRSFLPTFAPAAERVSTKSRSRFLLPFGTGKGEKRTLPLDAGDLA